MNSPSNHVIEIDYLRCFAILAVIYIHTAAATTRVGEISNLDLFPVIYLENLAQFAVPLFICISGFVLYLSYKPSEGIRSFYRKRYLRIIPPYLIFSAVYLVANIFKTRASESIWNVPSFVDVISAYIFAESNPHMWFFIIIIELYFIYPILDQVYNAILKLKIEWLFLVTALLLQLLWNTWSSDIGIIIDGVSHPITNKIFLCMIFYFVLGMYINNHYAKIRNFLKTSWMYIISVLTGLLCMLVPILLPITNIETGAVEGLGFCTLVIFVLFSLGIYLADNAKCHLFVVIGVYSFGIYLIHPLIQGFFGYILFPMIGINPSMYLYYLLVFIFTSAISILGVYLIQKLPYHRYIIG